MCGLQLLMDLSKIDPISHEIENYGNDYGMSNIRCLHLEDDGEIFVGTGNGYYRFYPDDISSLKTQIKPYIKSFKVFDDPQKTNVYSDSINQIRLKPQQNFFSIEYGVGELFQQESNKLQHINLKGLMRIGKMPVIGNTFRIPIFQGAIILSD